MNKEKTNETEEETVAQVANSYFILEKEMSLNK